MTLSEVAEQIALGLQEQNPTLEIINDPDEGLTVVYDDYDNKYYHLLLVAKRIEEFILVTD